MKAIVTGGTRGIGRAIAVELNSRNTFVAVCSRKSQDGIYGGMRSFPCDMTIPQEVERFVCNVGPVDVVVHNCGGGGRYGTDEEVMHKNVGAMDRVVHYCLPHMLRQKWGRVIAIGSIFGHREIGAPRPIFHAAKAAQAAWIKAMSKDKIYVRNGITFNTVAPGNVYVEGKPRVDEEALPMGRMGRPEEVAKLVAFLCSDEAAWINGACLVIDGGESCAL